MFSFPKYSPLVSVLFRIIYSNIYHPGPLIPGQYTLKYFSDPNTHSPMPLFASMACIHICRGFYLHDMLSWAVPSTASFA